MKKYINLFTISLSITACLLIGGDAFALKFKSDEDRVKFCEEKWEQIEKIRKEIKETYDKDNIDDTKLEKLKNQLEQLKEYLDQASCTVWIKDHRSPESEN